PPSQFLYLDGVHDVTIEGITFDYSAGPPGFEAIAFYRSGAWDIHISNNIFMDSGVTDTLHDRAAIGLSGSSYAGIVSERIWITGNQAFNRMQLTGGGGPNPRDVFITGNYVKDASANAISVTACNARRLVIANNVLESAGGNAIVVGQDATTVTPGCTTES